MHTDKINFLLSMVLPNSIHSSVMAGSQTSPTNRNTRYKSYAQAVTAKPRIPLMHQHIVPPHQDDESRLSTLQTRVYRSSRTKGAHLLDISNVKDKYTDLQCIILLSQQHPNVHACVPLSDGPRRYLEVYIKPEEDTNDLINRGLTLPESKLTVIPSASIGENSKIIHLKLSHIPLLPQTDVHAGLEKSLAIFGKILDIGISCFPDTKIFMGTVYAVIDVYQDENTPQDKKFQELSHQINWCEDDDCFHATWSNMPVWCRYCHKDGHTKFDCPLSKARIICYSCHEHGHRSFECPRRNAPMKKRDRKSYQTKKEVELIIKDSDDDDNDSDYEDDAENEVEDDEMSITSADNQQLNDEPFLLEKDNTRTLLEQGNPMYIQNAINELQTAGEIQLVAQPTEAQD